MALSLPPLPQSVQNWTDAMLAAPFDGFKARVFYFFNSGRVQMPVMGPDDTACEVVKVAAAWGYKIIAYAARRLTKTPPIPPREADVEGGQTFLKESFAIDTPDPDATGAPQTYILSGWRLYALAEPLSPDEGDTLLGYWPPTMQGSPTQNTLGPDDLDPNQIPGLPANGNILLSGGGDGLFNIQGGSGGQVGIQGGSGGQVGIQGGPPPG